MIGTKETNRRLQVRELTNTPPGQTTQVEMVRGVQHLGLFIRVRADITIESGTVNGVVRNRGRAIAFIERIRLSENGDVSTDIDPRALDAHVASRAPRDFTQFTALATGGAQVNTILEDMIFLPFADPLLGNSFETAFVEKNARQPLFLEIETVPSYYNAIQNGADRTFTMNSLTVEIGQTIDRVTSALPFFIPVYRLLASEQITGVVNGLEIPLNVKGFVANLIIQQIGNGLYEASDIITALEIRGSRVRFDDGRFTPDWFRQAHEFKFGGSVPPGYTVRNLVTNGRFGGVHNPIVDPDINVIVDALPSVVFGTSSFIRVWGLEFLQDPSVTRPLSRASAALVQ